MIERALVLRRAIDRWVRDRDELAPLMLRQEEWEQLEQICALLKVSLVLVTLSFMLTYPQYSSFSAIYAGNPSDVPCRYADTSVGTSDVRIHAKAPPGIRNGM